MNKEKSINFDKDYRCMRFNKELYSKIALIKAAYNYLENAYIHLDMDEKYYYVFLKEKKEDIEIKEDDFMNEMLTQSVRHEVYLQTKNIRELLYARSLATSVIVDDESEDKQNRLQKDFNEDEILKDWFDNND